MPFFLSCGASDEKGECAPGDQRKCSCGEVCGNYLGCGDCINGLIVWSTTLTCKADSTWPVCNCYGAVEPECEGAESERCAGRCSRMLRDILYAFPSDLSETDCRRAFATLESCGGMCAEIGNYAGCEAEVAALDAACLESPPTCP